MRIDSSFARTLVHDVAWHCDMNCVRSEDAHKQLGRMSLNNLCELFIYHKRHGYVTYVSVCTFLMRTQCRGARIEQ